MKEQEKRIMANDEFHAAIADINEQWDALDKLKGRKLIFTDERWRSVQDARRVIEVLLSDDHDYSPSTIVMCRTRLFLSRQDARIGSVILYCGMNPKLDKEPVATLVDGEDGTTELCTMPFTRFFDALATIKG